MFDRLVRYVWLVAVWAVLGNFSFPSRATASPTSPIVKHPSSVTLGFSPCSVTGVTIAPCDPSQSVLINQTTTLHFTISASGFVSYHAPLVITCTGVVISCSSNPTSVSINSNTEGFDVTWTVSATPGTGAVQVRTGNYLLSTISVTSTQINDFALDTTTVGQTDQLLGLCAVECFAATVSHNTVPYYTIDTPRQLTLLYSEERAHPRPFISADVGITAGAATPTYYTLSAQLNGSAVTFLNGDAVLYFAGSPSHVRLSGQFDATSFNTGTYSLVITVTAMFPGGTSKTHSYTRQLTIVNETHSSVARGWTIAGIWHLYILPTGGYLATDGRGNAVSYPSYGIGFGAPGADSSILTYDTFNHTYTRTGVDGSRAVFNSTGFMTSVCDRRSLCTTVSYDTQNRLQYVYDPMFKNTTVSRYIELQYGANGLSAIQEHGPSSSTRTTTVAVGTDSNLTEIMDPDSATVQYTYDINSRISTETDRRGGVTTFVYDTNSWKVSEVHLPQIPVDAGSGTTHDSIPIIKYQSWQGVGVPTVHTSITSTAVAPLQTAIVGRVVDPRGQPIRFTPNPWGQPIQLYDTLGNTQTITYQNYLPTVIHEIDGSYDSVTYSKTLVASVRQAGKPRRYYHYGVFGQVDSTWGSGASVERYYLNSLTGNVDSIKTAGVSMNMERLTYDSLGRLTVDVDPAGHTTRYHYDAVFGNIDSVTMANGAGPKSVFDIYGRDSTVQTPGSAISTTVYDILNRPIKQYDGISATPEILTYDALFLTSVKDRAGNVTSFTYDAGGMVTQRCDALSACATYRYDAGNLLTSFTNRRGQRVNMTYDAIGRMLSKNGAGVTADSFSYSPNGLVVVARNNVEIDSTVVSPGSSVVGASETKISWLDGVRYKIVHGDLSSWAGKDSTVITTNSGVTYLSQYLTADTTTGLLLSNNDGFQTTTYSYTDEKLEYSATSSYGGAKQTYWPTHRRANEIVGPLTSPIYPLMRFYGYDGSIRLNTIFQTTTTPVNHPMISYVYDQAGRIKQSIRGDCSTFSSADSTTMSCTTGQDTTTILNYSYDSVGNWVNDRGFGAGNRLLSTAFYDASYSYDDDGNLISRSHSELFWPVDSGNFLYQWSADGRLTYASRDGQPAVYYDYNAYGQPVRKWHGDPSSGGVVVRRYIYDRGQLVAELDATSSNHRIAQYIYETDTDRPYAMVTGVTSPSQIHYFFQDEAGNVIGLLNGTTVKQTDSYSDWGVPTITGDTTNRLLWKGLVYDSETRLYYMRNRWYSADLARFLSEDPAGFVNGLNLYNFSKDDPINGQDPSGLDSFNGGDNIDFSDPISVGSFLGKVLRAHGRNLGKVPPLVVVGKTSGKPTSIWDDIQRIGHTISVVIGITIGLPSGDKSEPVEGPKTEQVEPDKKPSAAQRFRDMVDDFVRNSSLPGSQDNPLIPLGGPFGASNPLNNPFLIPNL